MFCPPGSKRESNTIVVWNNGKGIPVVEHKDEKMYVPALIFGHLLTSSNYDDNEKKVTGNTITPCILQLCNGVCSKTPLLWSLFLLVVFCSCSAGY